LKPLEKIPVPGTIDMADLLKSNEPEAPNVEIDVFNDLAHLAYTGGTTGLSRNTKPPYLEERPSSSSPW